LKLSSSLEEEIENIESALEYSENFFKKQEKENKLKQDYENSSNSTEDLQFNIELSTVK